MHPEPFVAQAVASPDGARVELNNGLVRRIIQLGPNAATISFDNLMTGESLLRSVRPEARVQLDGVSFEVGGLSGQPIDNYLSTAWLNRLTSNPSSFHYVGLKTGRAEPRFAWKKRPEWLSTGPALAAARCLPHVGI